MLVIVECGGDATQPMYASEFAKSRQNIAQKQVFCCDKDYHDQDDGGHGHSERCDGDTCLQDKLVVVHLQSVHSFSAQVLLYQNCSHIIEVI